VNNCSYVRGFCNKGITNPNGVFSGETCTIGAELIKHPQHCTIYISHFYLIDHWKLHCLVMSYVLTKHTRQLESQYPSGQLLSNIQVIMTQSRNGLDDVVGGIYPNSRSLDKLSP
jgi:hypothetical protein